VVFNSGLTILVKQQRKQEQKQKQKQKKKKKKKKKKKSNSNSNSNSNNNNNNISNRKTMGPFCKVIYLRHTSEEIDALLKFL